MSDIMRPLPLGDLLLRIVQEYERNRSVFGLHESTWYRKSDTRTVSIMGETAATALGPAAGPHTQLAQNIVAAYLTGSRCIELKTVQILDNLEIPKPCISVPDEGYNTEWSTELTLQGAWEEYVKAWILLHLMEELRGLSNGVPRPFLFTMSVGYDLEGIKNPRMQQFIDRMVDSSGESRFQEWLREIREAVPALLADTALAQGSSRSSISSLHERITGRMCRTVTLSTMHGCPPEEIESICRHLLIEKQLDTFVKLNPTLPGFDVVRTILDQLGYDYVELDQSGFEHDLPWDRAVEILRTLRHVAASAGRHFGVKLTNTLATVHGEEQRYLSGRALYPLAMTVAARLSREFHGQLPISYSGGITARNVAGVFGTGIRPITACTDLLKPGGYSRQTQTARILEGVGQWTRTDVDIPSLERLAADALADETVHKRFRGETRVQVSGEMPRFDCYRAPCVDACPIGQKVPEYIRLVGEERYTEALELIYRDNALPGITGYICDHQCQEVCSRLDYDGCLNIRELKKIAVLNGAGFRDKAAVPAVTPAPRQVTAPCAVVGAGPAGLAAAYFLARRGVSVTVFEREPHAGGVVRNVIPAFRLPLEIIEADIEYIARRGVRFEYGVDPTLTAASLRSLGFGPIVLAIGAEKDNELPLEGDRSRVIRSLDFLWTYRGNTRDDLSLRHREPGSRIVVVGGGNTAMDAARAAVTLPGVEQVTVLYRRSEREMPADREEYENARADGVVFRFLRNPERLQEDGTLTVRVMELGEPDSSGRRRPLLTDRTETLQVDTVIAAIGEHVDEEVLPRFGVDPTTLTPALPDVYLIGDALTGPSTVVRCIAAGRRVAETILGTPDAMDDGRSEPVPESDGPPHGQRLDQLLQRKACILPKPDAGRYTDSREFAAREYDRCLDCSYLCNRCVEVCPNRANIAVPTREDPHFRDAFQIVHLDALCNECGNCGHFCPWNSLVPYRDKPTIFSTREDFENSTNDGWLVGREPETGVGAPEMQRFSGPPAEENRFQRLYEILLRERPELLRRLD